MTNHVGHFYLTELLLPSLIKNGNGRIVNVSSVAHDRISFGGKRSMGIYTLTTFIAARESMMMASIINRNLPTYCMLRNWLSCMKRMVFMPFRYIQEL